MTAVEAYRKALKLAKQNEDALDDLVHNVKSAEASRINNSGCAEQLAYLLAEMTENEFIQAIQGLLDGNEMAEK